MPKAILSPVGTSLLTNLADDNRKLLTRHANDSEKEIPDEVKAIVSTIEEKVQTLIRGNNHADLKTAGAEFNSILSFYDGNMSNQSRDIPILLATDTFLGRRCAILIRSYLERYFDVVDFFIPDKLSTRSKEAFQYGIRDLMRWCDETLKGYGDAGYEIIFNLTGGFKSLQGYLNTIGMFYADRIIYIFEGSDQLITIPRLPIKIASAIFEKQAALFLQLSQTNEGIQNERLKAIPEMMIENYQEDKYILSDWGELSWNNAKRDIIANGLIDLPYIDYAASFIKDFNKTKGIKDKVNIQEVVGKVSCYLQENQGDITSLKGGKAGGLLYDNYSGKNSYLGHFRIGKGPRISCEYRDQMLELRHCGAHDYVNDNP